MKVIPKSVISSWNDKSQVDKMKHQHSLRKEVNPERDLTRIKGRSRVSAPRAPRQRQINPDRIRQILSEPIVTQSPYNEYKDSLKKCSGSVIAKTLGDDDGETLKKKITDSKDIQTIITNQVCSFPTFENELIVLGLTLTGKFLESKFGV